MKKHPKLPEYLSLQNYTLGFISSLILTFCAYVIVVSHVDSGHSTLSHRSITSIILVLAVTQLMVQSIYFLHIGRGKSALWNVVAYLFMLGVVTIIVVGSLWIMKNLDYHHGESMTPAETNKHIQSEEAIQPEAHH